MAVSMLVTGGFTSRTAASRELWKYDLSTEQWTPLANLPVPIAAHTSTYTAGGVIIVIGGVTDDLSTRANVMSYNVSHDSWEVWPLTTIQMPGVYGHSTVYDAKSQCLWVFGCVAYTRPSSTLSASLHSLHVPSRTWTIIKLQDQISVFPRRFQSMVLVNAKLFIYGGLVADSRRRGLEGACPSNDITLIMLESNSTHGKTTLSLQGDLPVRWGHSAVMTTHQQVVFTGGMDGQPVDSIDVLHNANNFCSLAQNLSQCQSISDCLPCVNMTDDSLIGCYGIANFSSEMCRYLGGEQGQGTPVNFPIGCGSFPSCDSCLATDVSRRLGCIWCSCDYSNSSCIAASECPCSAVNATAPVACLLESCWHASCGDCLRDDRCSWLRTTNQNTTSVSREFTEWGCYQMNVSDANTIDSDFNASISSCPGPCSNWMSCEGCVLASSPDGGALTCVWSTYSKECMSEGSVPLLCAGGKCGAIATLTSQCVPGCSQRFSCNDCQKMPQCRWKSNEGSFGICVEITDLDEVQLSILYKCPNCPSNCTEHGYCVSMGHCLCDLGYVGEMCEVPCECNGLSNCVNVTEEGRRICVHCHGNTQGPSCNECMPNFVRLADGGRQCYPCLDFCNGNSAVCINLSEGLNVGDMAANYSKVAGKSEPRESGVVCLMCTRGTRGSRCHQCLNGYYNTTQKDGGGSQLNCTKCSCNGRNGQSDKCDNMTGLCICRNNTVSTSNIHNQCNVCANGYIGTPLNNSQCYKQLEANNIVNYMLPSRHAAFIAIRSNSRMSNIDIYISIVLVHGSLDIYVSPLSTAVKLVAGAGGTNHISISNKYQLVDKTRSRRSAIPTESGPQLKPEEMARVKRDFYGSILSSSQDNIVLKYHIIDRFILIIPPGHSDILTNAEHFITFFSQKNSSFFLEYMQEVPTINFNIFFGLFFAQMIFTSCFLLAICKSIHAVMDRRRAILNRRLRERRAYRPIASIVLYLHSGKEATSIHPDESKLEVDCSDEDDRPILSMGSTAPTKRERHKKGKGASTHDTKMRKTLEVLDANDIAIWPITMQTTADENASVYSVIVQTPSRNSPRHMLCAGSFLVHHTERSGVDQPTSGMALRRLKNRESAARTLTPVLEDAAEVTTQL